MNEVTAPRNDPPDLARNNETMMINIGKEEDRERDEPTTFGGRHFGRFPKTIFGRFPKTIF